MAGFGDLIQKAVYLGVGLADYAAERAAGALQDLRNQAQKLADEMVERGEMNVEEARKFVDQVLQEAQQKPPVVDNEEAKEPRRIEIVEEPDSTDESNVKNVEVLRQKVQELQEELRRLQDN